ncbi:MAG TPA: DUF4386 domain-containing protein [Pyrinomonadaceae bacterium]|nr:DUF4386 domain-containing protein [Pyrinomonadaceae bacterium]
MTRTTNARLAGFMFLFYIATGITSMVLSNRVTGGAVGTAVKLASMAQNAQTIRLTVLLTFCGAVSAVALGVTLYALTRDEDRELALLAMCSRVAEGVLAAVAANQMLQLLVIATASTAGTADAATARALGGLILEEGSIGIIATCFIIGSTIFSYLFLRARSIPRWLAWLGLIASVLLLVAYPLEIVGVIKVPFVLWMPMLVLELTFAAWLIFTGVRIGAVARP